jgi:small subunit ribosomal protein S8
MTMTDPIADMLTRLRNANQAYHDTTGMPYSRIKANIAEVLRKEGYIGAWSVQEPADGGPVGRTLVLSLKYGPNRERSLAGILREVDRSTAGPGRPRRRDHLDLDGAADRSPGR